MISRFLCLLIVIVLGLMLVQEIKAAQPPMNMYTKAVMNYVLPKTAKRTAVDARCATNQVEWGRLVTAAGDYDPTWTSGFARWYNGKAILRFAPWVCREIKRGPAAINSSMYNFGAALYVVAHEAIHGLGYRNEADVSCMALRWGHKYLLKKFWPQYSKLLPKIDGQVRWYYLGQPPEYLSTCKP